MTLTGLPGWVVPTARQVADARAIGRLIAARAEVGAYRGPRMRGLADTIAWLLGEQPAPISAQADAAARADAEREAMRAMFATTDGSGDPIYPQAVADTLTWLLGVRADACPVRLPTRRPDGKLATADDIYAALVDGRRLLEPEDRDRLRAQAAAEARRSAELAAVVDATSC